MIPSTLRASKIIITFTRNNGCKNFNRREVFVSKKVKVKVLSFFGWTQICVNAKYFIVFVFPFYSL